ncbi:MAG: hypothetical protein J2P48_00275 [Alphaproteobacteria bacterium]|nr:hypothetical protein [Alphaproteobacteria bacterium]
MPHYAGADLLAESWRTLGVTTTQDGRNIWDWQKVIDSGEFDVALDFSGDFYGDRLGFGGGPCSSPAASRRPHI